MSRSLPKGEYLLCGLFALLGVIWIAIAARMPFWEGFAPQSGFLPFVYGLALLALSGATLFSLISEPPTYEEATASEPLRKPLTILAALAAAVIGLNAAGFATAIFLLLLFLFVVVERLSPVMSTIVAAATVAVLVFVFRWWLNVPLPIGPFGV